MVSSTSYEPTLVIAAHPDDETIGAGALLSRLSTSNSRVWITHLTPGAPKHYPNAREYGEERRREAIRAMSLAGIAPEHVTSLAFVDQKLSESLVPCALEIERLISLHRPRWILTHPYEGGHPDHDSAAFCTHLAVKRTRRDRGASDPIRVIEFTSYFSRTGQAGSPMVTSEFLDAGRTIAWTCPLSDNEQELKNRMFACFRTQAEVLRYFSPPSLERFREAPNYDFRSPPHRGILFYEQFDWGMTGERWRALAERAMKELETS